jgi:carbonic anhydrase
MRMNRRDAVGLALTMSGAVLERAVEANVRWSLQQLRALPEAQMILNEHKSILTGAVYELDSGRVRWLQEANAL